MHVIEARRADLEPALELTISYEGEQAVLRATGEIEMATAPVISEVAGCVLRAGAPDLVIDLTAVEFIDLDGVRALLDLDTLAAEGGSRFAVLSPHGAVRRVFEVTGASRRLRMLD